MLVVGGVVATVDDGAGPQLRLVIPPLAAMFNSSGTAYAAAGKNPGAAPISQELLDKHFFRKHGAKAYYGQIKR